MKRTFTSSVLLALLILQTPLTFGLKPLNSVNRKSFTSWFIVFTTQRFTILTSFLSLKIIQESSQTLKNISLILTRLPSFLKICPQPDPLDIWIFILKKIILTTQVTIGLNHSKFMMKKLVWSNMTCTLWEQKNRQSLLTLRSWALQQETLIFLCFVWTIQMSSAMEAFNIDSTLLLTSLGGISTMILIKFQQETHILTLDQLHLWELTSKTFRLEKFTFQNHLQLFLITILTIWTQLMFWESTDVRVFVLPRAHVSMISILKAGQNAVETLFFSHLSNVTEERQHQAALHLVKRLHQIQRPSLQEALMVPT